MPAGPVAEGDKMGAGEDCVSLSSLAMPDGEAGDQMANPEVGDKVNYQIEGTVTRIEGDNAYVKRESVNGKPVGGEAAEEEPDPELQADDQERGELGGLAGGMGNLS